MARPYHLIMCLSLALLCATAGQTHARGHGRRTPHLAQQPKRMSLMGNLIWMLKRPQQVKRRFPATPRRRRHSMLQAKRMMTRPVGKGVWSNIRWAEVQTRLKQHLKDPNSLDQGKLHLCMNAVALSTTAKINPERYVKLVREVYAQGTFNGHPISPRLLAAAPKSTDPLDWMMLSAMRNAYGRSKFLGQIGFRLTASNFPAEMNRMLTEVTGFRKVRTHTRFLRSATGLIPRLNRQLAASEANEAVLLMSMKGLRKHKQGHNMHWTRLTSKIIKLPPAAQISQPKYDANLGTLVVRWKEADGTRGEKSCPRGPKQAATFAKMLTQPRVKFSLFDHGQNLPVHTTERIFGRQVLLASMPTP